MVTLLLVRLALMVILDVMTKTLPVTKFEHCLELVDARC